jgi:hypothetical protein
MAINLPFSAIINFYIFLENLSPIDVPSVFRTAPVYNSDAYEKSLCKINSNLTYTDAKTYCKSLGMRLYRPNSSSASKTALLEFGQDEFAGESTSIVYVEGTSENQCLIFDGSGGLNYGSCNRKINCICEFVERGKSNNILIA